MQVDVARAVLGATARVGQGWRAGLGGRDGVVGGLGSEGKRSESLERRRVGEPRVYVGDEEGVVDLLVKQAFGLHAQSDAHGGAMVAVVNVGNEVLAFVIFVMKNSVDPGLLEDGDGVAKAKVLIDGVLVIEQAGVRSG